MITPTIHLNGTGGQDLLDQACEAARALNKAADVLASVGPNARDYYPQGDHAFPQARREHEERMAKLRALAAEYEAMAEAIADTMDERRLMRFGR